MPTASPGPRARRGATQSSALSGPAPCGTFPGAAPRFRRRAPGELPAAGLVGEGGLNPHAPFSGSGLGAGLPPSSAAAPLGRRTTPRTPRRRRGRLLQRRSALGWERAVGGRGCLGAELTPTRVTGCHLEGRGGWASTRSVSRKGLRELFEGKITKTKRGLVGVAPPPGATAQLTAPPPTVPVPPSLLPSFQAASLMGLLPRLPSYESVIVKSPLRLFLWPLSQPAPPIRPWGSSPAPGAGTPRTNAASLKPPRSLPHSGHLYCPLEKGPLSMGRWDFFFINSICMVSIPSKDCIISESYFLMGKMLVF